MASNDTFFTNDVGSAAASNSYIQDTLPDYSLPASSNSGFTDTASTNPIGQYFQNSDTIQFGAKTLYVKDIVLIPDRSKWVNNRPTYQIIWNENFPAVFGYCFNDAILTYKQEQACISFSANGGGVGVNAIARKIAWIVSPSTAASSTAQLALDGVNTSTVSFGAQSTDGYSVKWKAKYNAFIAESSNETRDLHDFRILTQASPNNLLELIGVIVYFENSGANIDIAPGVSYVNKTKVTTSSFATFPISTFGSSAGGVDLYYKTTGGAYANYALSVTTMMSIAQGSSGSNSLNLTTGTGGSFPIGSGVVVNQGGGSFYVGNVVNVSTDTLTVIPALPFGITNAIYKSWQTGATYGINASLMVLSGTIDFGQVSGVSVPILDKNGAYCFWTSTMGVSMSNGNYGSGIGTDSVNTFIQVAKFATTLASFQIDGNFSAVDIEFAGTGALQGFFSVNGITAFSMADGLTGTIRKTIFTDAGQGWNSVLFNGLSGLATTNLGISKINMYSRQRYQGITYGLVGQVTTQQAVTHRGLANCTLMSLGLYRRVYADHLYLSGSWVRSDDSTAAGGVKYIGSSTNSTINLQYYGKDVGLIGTAATSGTFLIDSAPVANTFNAMNSVSSEGFHSLSYNVRSGTCIISAVDYTRARGEVKSLDNYLVTPSAPKKKNITVYGVTASSSYSNGAVDRVVMFDKKIIDNLNQVPESNSTSWKWVSAQTGYFSVKCVIQSDPTLVSMTAGDYILMNLYRNGVLVGPLAVWFTDATKNSYLTISGGLDVFCAVGDHLQVTLNLSTTAGSIPVFPNSNICITRLDD